MRSDYLAYALIDVIVDHYFVVLERLSDQIESTEEEAITDPTSEVLQKINGFLIQVTHTLETLRSAVSELFDTYTSAVNHRMNEVMKVLTIVATFFIPLTFIAGIYGMNFKFMPELETQWGYPVVLLFMAGIGIAMFVYFKLRKWF